MKIIFAANTYVDRGIPKDGFLVYLYRVTRALAALGHEPIIIYCSNRNAHRTENGVRIYAISRPPVLGKRQWVKTISDSLGASYAINKKIKELSIKEKIDIVQFTSLNALPLLCNCNIPSVMRLSSYAKIAYPSNETLDKLTIKVMAFMEVLSGKRCNAVFAPSNVTAQHFQKDFRRRTYVVETPYLNDVCEYDYSYRDKHISASKYVLFFGNMYYEKGITVIARIIRQFLEENEEYYFVFVGKNLTIKGKSAANLILEEAGEYQNRVIISSPLSHEQLYPVIEDAQFVVLPSIMENLSNACIEAMYLSKVVIGTDGASFEQLITHGENGLLCKINDADDLLKKMQDAVKLDLQKKRSMEMLAHKRIERLKPEIVVAQLLELYKAVIKNCEKDSPK